MATSQEDATEWTIKRAKQECPLEFHRKWHKKQYVFNAKIGDRIKAVAKVKKINVQMEKDVKVAQEALDELRVGRWFTRLGS